MTSTTTPRDQMARFLGVAALLVSAFLLFALHEVTSVGTPGASSVDMVSTRTVLSVGSSASPAPAAH
ncbi:hypothetical protein [Rubrivirga sp.]|uniref:hypothetical protein n=1 Tax=Rubrivirga sp. TaxID=1885344 RepID=UPI003C745E14